MLCCCQAALPADVYQRWGLLRPVSSDEAGPHQTIPYVGTGEPSEGTRYCIMQSTN